MTDNKDKAVENCPQKSCTAPHYARGMCKRHYRSWWKKASKKSCGVRFCMSDSEKEGFCVPHWQWWMGHGCPPEVPFSLPDLQPKRPKIPLTKPFCSAPGCDKEVSSYSQSGMCGLHQRRHKAGIPFDREFKTRSTEAGEPRTVRGEKVLVRRHKHTDGYVYLSCLNPRTGARFKILEHRVIMEDLLGRTLTTSETVHHVNGQRDDNRQENLELWSSSQPAGQRVKDKVNWAREILALYGGEYK